MHAGIPPSPPPTPGADTPPGTDTLREQTPPGAVHAGRYGQQAGSTHPTGMQSCVSLISGSGGQKFKI